MPDLLLISDLERKMKSLKRRLEHWREFLVGLYSILMWNEPWYPALIVGVTTSLFLTHWYFNPPFLASICFLILIVNFLDLLIPKVINAFYPPQQWTAAKEKTYELMCEGIVKIQDTICGFFLYMKDLKISQPTAYSVYLFVGCFTVAWLSLAVNNWILFYLLVTTLALLPGIKENKVIDKWAFKIFNDMSDRLRGGSKQEKLKTN